MKRSRAGERWHFALVLFTLLVTGCSALAGSSQFDTNGERIYQTGTSANGPISYSGGDLDDNMMGGQGMMGGDSLACADCHGPDGRGGPHIMHMEAMEAPDIRWSTLSESEHGDHGAKDQDEMEHPPYDEEAFYQAVTEGMDPGGGPLDPAMPRWQISNQDLRDLLAYLKMLD